MQEEQKGGVYHVEKYLVVHHMQKSMLKVT